MNYCRGHSGQNLAGRSNPCSHSRQTEPKWIHLTSSKALALLLFNVFHINARIILSFRQDSIKLIFHAISYCELSKILGILILFIDNFCWRLNLEIVIEWMCWVMRHVTLSVVDVWVGCWYSIHKALSIPGHLRHRWFPLCRFKTILAIRIFIVHLCDLRFCPPCASEHILSAPIDTRWP